MPEATSTARELAGRWYTHGWNREISWRLVLGVVPKIPVVFRPLLHFLATLVCFSAMPRERRSARRNLERVTGRTGAASLMATFRLFYNFSKFVTAFIDLTPFRPEKLEGRVKGGDAVTEAIRAALGRGRGLVVLTLHQGQYEVGLALLRQLGVPVTVVVLPEESAAAAQVEERARSDAAVRVLRSSDSNLVGIELMLALRRNEIVALQADRSGGGATRRIPLFGAPVDLPAGPLLLAAATGAPILLVVTLIRGHRCYELVHRGPFEPPSQRAGEALAEKDLKRAHRELAGNMEVMIRLAPEQWFNFYDVWKHPGGEGEGR